MRYKKLNKDKIFFISDPHFGHANIIKYCNRPFETVEEMDLELIKRWNEKVPEGSMVFCLGDFAYRAKNKLKSYTDQLNGDIYLTLGNHDKYKDVIKSGAFKDVQGYYDLHILDDEMDDGFQRITTCHFPMYSWAHSHRGSWMFYGHTHGTFPPPTFRHLELCVELWDYGPASYEECKLRLTQNAMKHE